MTHALVAGEPYGYRVPALPSRAGSAEFVLFKPCGSCWKLTQGAFSGTGLRTGAHPAVFALLHDFCVVSFGMGLSVLRTPHLHHSSSAPSFGTMFSAKRR